MPYGRLSLDQRKTLAKFVRGKIVHDLGAGDLTLSHELLKLGAAEVYAIDKDPKPSSALPSRLHYKREYFHNVKSRMDTVFLSWPANYDTNVVPLVQQAGTVIYLGCNTGGSMCGTPELFKAMILRELLAYEPHRENSLVIVGKVTGAPRLPTGEELAGLNVMSSYYSFDEAERLGL